MTQVTLFSIPGLEDPRKELHTVLPTGGPVCCVRGCERFVGKTKAGKWAKRCDKHGKKIGVLRDTGESEERLRQISADLPAAEAPSGEFGRWVVTSAHVTQAGRAWVLNHRKVWPFETSPVIAPKERRILRDLLEMYGPDLWERMAANVCAGWTAIRDTYKIPTLKPNLYWVYANRNDVVSAVDRGGFRSRSNRDSSWATSSEEKSGFTW